MSMLPNCVLCGRFVGWNKACMVWRSEDVVPVTPKEYAHVDCWKSPSHRTLVKFIKQTSWVKPTVRKAV